MFNFRKFLTNFKNKFRGKASFEDLIRNTPKPYKDRSLQVGLVNYIGYKFVYDLDKGLLSKLVNWLKSITMSDGVPVVSLLLKFQVQGAPSRTGRREDYFIFVKIPYFKDMKTSDVFRSPISYYCQCASFKYFMAYALNATEQVYTTEGIKKDLGIALTQEPKIRNPEEIQFLCKHAYKLSIFIKGKTIDSFLLSSKYNKDIDK